MGLKLGLDRGCSCLLTLIPSIDVDGAGHGVYGKSVCASDLENGCFFLRKGSREVAQVRVSKGFRCVTKDEGDSLS